LSVGVADPVVVAVPAEMLAGMAEAMRDAAAEAKETHKAVDAHSREVRDALARIEPALKAHEDYVRRLGEQDSQATAEARQATRRAETEAAQQRAQMRSLIIQIVLALGGLALGAGGMSALGGSP
jgi:ABC-type transporter Mla subunit MlaD